MTTPRLTVDLPRGFAGLALGETAARTAANVRVAASHLAVHSGQPEERVAQGLVELAAMMAPHRVLVFGRFAVGDPPALATLALAVVPVSPPVTESVLLRNHRDRHPHAEAGIVAFPAGRAMVAVTAGTYRLPPALTGAARTVVHPEFTLELQIPAGSHVVVLAVTTADEHGWPAVAAEAMRVAGSMSVAAGER